MILVVLDGISSSLKWAATLNPGWELGADILQVLRRLAKFISTENETHNLIFLCQFTLPAVPCHKINHTNFCYPIILKQFFFTMSPKDWNVTWVLIVGGTDIFL